MQKGDKLRFKLNSEIGVGVITSIDTRGMVKVEFDNGGYFYGHCSDFDKYFISADPVYTAAQQAAPAMGMSTAEAVHRINCLVRSAPGIPSEVVQKLEKLERDERWRTDPLQIGKKLRVLWDSLK